MTWTWPRIERRTALLMFAAFLVLGVWQGNTAWLAMQADHAVFAWSHPYFWEVTGTLSAFAWSWIPCATAKNAPRPAGRWPRFLAIHAAGYALFAPLHTALMLGVRVALYPVLGWGAYHYGGTSFRLPMEWHKDLLAYVLITVGYGLITSWREAQRRALREAQIATELRDAQLRALIAQLNPHFLFNALNTISAVMYTDLARTDRLLADLGQMLRAGLAGNAAPTWSLAEERCHTEHFLDLMLARFGDRLSVVWKLEDRACGAQVPRFTLQLLVENAIKHNQDARGLLEIAISARRAGALVELEVADNGRGFGDSPARGPGTGLATLRRALELCHGAASRLELARAPEGGACVRLSVPAEAAA
ncbi:MAG TPA: histidine kinase [Kofleriaceae bacterium]|nr:histidine kinase [Kofleriaceae bacterium]